MTSEQPQELRSVRGGNGSSEAEHDKSTTPLQVLYYSRSLKHNGQEHNPTAAFSILSRPRSACLLSYNTAI